MNIKHLKELIKNLPDDMEVILQKDAEGNSFSPLSDADSNGIYIPITSWHGDVYDSAWTADDADMDEKEWEEIKSKTKTLILRPIN